MVAATYSGVHCAASVMVCGTKTRAPWPGSLSTSSEGTVFPCEDPESFAERGTPLGVFAPYTLITDRDGRYEMPTWDQLKAYIHSNYKATDVSPRAIEMVFSLAADRSQAVWVSFLEGPNGEQWASIDSAIGRLDSIDLGRALKMIENVTCGGLAHLLYRGESLVVIRHCVPLRNLDPTDFDPALLMVTAAANGFEGELAAQNSL